MGNLEKGEASGMCAIRILIVEDDRDIGDLFQAALEPPHECLRAANGMEGFQMVIEGEPDVIVTDIMMPIMDGFEFVEMVRKDPRFEKLPVVFISALGSREKIKRGYDIGGALYLTKPIPPLRLQRNLEIFFTDHDIVEKPKSRDIEAVRKGPALAAPAAPEQTDETEPPKHDEMTPKAQLAHRPPMATLNEAVEHARAEAEAKKAQGAAAASEHEAKDEAEAEHEAEVKAEHEAKVQAAHDASAKAGKPAQEGAEARRAPKPGSIKARKSLTTAMTASMNPVKTRVLLVEDDSDALELMALGMEPDYELILARDGLEAIERAARWKPDIFVIDGMLPKMTGYQMVSMLKKNALFSDTPIIFISGKTTIRDRQYVNKLGVKTFLAKPFEVEDLVEEIMKIEADPSFKIRESRPPFQQMAYEMTGEQDRRR